MKQKSEARFRQSSRVISIKDALSSNELGLGAGRRVNFNFLATYSCSNDCDFCLSSDYMGAFPGGFADMDQIIGHAYKTSKLIGGFDSLYISGGDPMLHPDILRILKHVRRIARFVSVNTNGVLLDNEDTFKEAAKYVDHFIFSLHDSTADGHNAIVRCGNSFETVVSAIKNAARFKADHSISLVLTRKTVARAAEICKFILGVGAPSSILVANIVPIGKALANYKDISYSLLGFDKTADEVVKLFRKAKSNAFFPNFPPCSLGKHSGRCADFSADDDFEFYPVFKDGVFTAMDIYFNPVLQYKEKPPVCGGCSEYDRCQGVMKEYLKLYGAEGINPI